MIADPSRVDALIRGPRYAAIALCMDNEPYVVTLDYGHDAVAGVLYFHCAKDGRKIDFIKANPRARVTVVESDSRTLGRCDPSTFTQPSQTKLV